MRRFSRSSAVLLALAIGVTVPSLPVTSRAAPGDGDRSAARFFAEGQKAFSAGDYPRAAEQFELAYKERPHHAPLWNAARSWQRAGDDIRAANLYARYLREAPADAPDRDNATTSLKELTAKLGRIEPHASGVQHLRLDGKAVEAPVIYVAPGEHVAEGNDSDGAVRKVVKVSAGQIVAISVTREPKIEPPRAPPGRVEERRGLSPWVTVVGGVLTAAAGGVTIAFGSNTVTKKHAFLEERSQANLDSAQDAQTRTNIALATTGGLALVTTVIAVFFTDWGGGNDKAANPRVGER